MRQTNMANILYLVVAFAALFVSALAAKYKSGDKVASS